MQLTSWQGGSGRLEEGRSPAQVARQLASAQQQSQAGLQGDASPRRAAPGGRPRPLPRACIPLRSAGGPKDSLPRWGALRLSGREGCTLYSPPARPLPVRGLTAPLRSPPGQPALVLPSRRREGPRDAGAARGRDAGRGRGCRGAGGAGGGCGPAERVLRGLHGRRGPEPQHAAGAERGRGPPLASLTLRPHGPPEGALQGCIRSEIQDIRTLFAGGGALKSPRCPHTTQIRIDAPSKHPFVKNPN